MSEVDEVLERHRQKRQEEKLARRAEDVRNYQRLVWVPKPQHAGAGVTTPLS